MVISIDSVLIKQLGELLNVISINIWQDERRFEFYFADNVILTHIATPTAFQHFLMFIFIKVMQMLCQY